MCLDAIISIGGRVTANRATRFFQRAPGEFPFFSEVSNVRAEVPMDRESVWLTKERVGLLFGREHSVITTLIRNVFAEGEFGRSAVCAKFAHCWLGQCE